MENDWKSISLGEILNFKRGHDLPKSSMNMNGQIPVVGSNGIIGYHDESKCEEVCLTIGRSGNVGSPYLLEEDAWPHNTTLYVNDFKGNNYKYLYYLLETLQLGRHAGGSAVPTLNRNHIHPIEINLPPIQEQKAIAHILGTLDDKIELNRKMNETLEDMAKALFKSWFVDFDPVLDKALVAGNEIPEPLQAKAEKRKALGDKRKPLPVEIADLFPDSFTFTEELGWIPEGWEVNKIGSLCDVSSSKRIFAKEYQDTGIPFYRGKEISKLSKGEQVPPEIFISFDKFQELEDKYGVPEEGDILITSVGTIGNIYKVRKGDQFYFKDGNVISLSGFKSRALNQYVYSLLRSKLFVHEIEKITIGSTQQALTITGLGNIKIIIPAESLIENFSKFIASTQSKVSQSDNQIHSLISLRNTLLPKLISGELRVPEAAKMVENY